MHSDDERSAGLIVEGLAMVAASGGSLLEAAEEVAKVSRRTTVVLERARQLSAAVEDPEVREQVRLLLELLVETGLLGTTGVDDRAW